MATDPTPSFPSRDEIEPVLERVLAEAREFLAAIDEADVRAPVERVDAATAAFDRPLPEEGAGAAAALAEMLDRGRDAILATAGPRCYHFVMGGVTPAALGPEMLAPVFDQPAYAWISSPLGVELERIALGWLRDLFGLPAEGGGVLTTGATMANFTGLAAARQWWGERHGVDVAERGFAGLPEVPVFSSGHIHPAAVKALAMLGIGRTSVRRLTCDARGSLDLEALERDLAALGGAPAIVVGNAGEVNAGEFDPIAAMADLAREHRAWLHVDGAFSLFARLSPRTAHLADGVERADSVIADGHKWLNVPYDCGFAFVRDPALLARAFAYTAAYLPGLDDPRPNFGAIGPESSRRSRGLAVWATLRAYGRAGYRAMVERHLDLALHLAAAVDDAPELERMAEVPLNIVCFRCNPGGRSPEELDDLNRRLAAAILDDGRFYVGPTTFEGKAALRPAIVNWRIREEDIDHFVAVVREVAGGLARP